MRTKSYIEIIIAHTEEVHSEPKQTFKIEAFAKMINYFRKKWAAEISTLVFQSKHAIFDNIKFKYSKIK